MAHSRKFEYGETAILKKGGCGILVKVGIRFDSFVKSNRNRSGISYYIDGYEIRNWCYEEELRKFNIFSRVFRWVKIVKNLVV